MLKKPLGSHFLFKLAHTLSTKVGVGYIQELEGALAYMPQAPMPPFSKLTKQHRTVCVCATIL